MQLPLAGRLFEAAVSSWAGGRHAIAVRGPNRIAGRGAGTIGNLGGFFGPWYVGVKDLTGSFAGGLYGLALTGLISAFVCAFFLHIPDRTSPAAMPAVGAHAG